MISNNDSMAITEVLDILEHMEQEQVDRISYQFMNYLKSRANKQYFPQLDYSKPLGEMNLNKTTRAILGLIYRKYWATPREKEIIQKILKNNLKKEEEEKRKKYNPDNIFKRVP